ncbi:MAG: hypothetical protein A2Y79_05765 [Deltaproteobacteria bacterium RBG_13_43_22]|nr:MAG: hypothetical protein A2Y79_05765 [Deltaproteobacteria bacterium RBG_13_43_22]
MTAFAFLNVDNPWIAWLVYRGEMVSPKAANARGLSIWHAYYLIDAAHARQRTAYYQMEMAIEDVRRDLFPAKVSRLSGLYFFEDAESAKRAGQRWDGNFREEHLAEIEIVGTPQISLYDSEWITHRMGSSDRSWVSSYLSGSQMGESPLWELLVEGRGFVLGTLVRERAYETVKRTWPGSLGLLELSRVAVELDSDLGLICPFLTIESDKVRLTLQLSFADAKDPAFLERFSKYKGPKNTRDLNASASLVVPDLTHHFVEFRL